MLQNPRKTLGLKKKMVYKIPPGGTISSQWPKTFYCKKLTQVEVGYRLLNVA